METYNNRHYFSFFIKQNGQPLVLRILVRCLDTKGIRVACREWCLKGFREITMFVAMNV
jgi:hypothetical protein